MIGDLIYCVTLCLNQNDIIYHTRDTLRLMSQTKQKTLQLIREKKIYVKDIKNVKVVFKIGCSTCSETVTLQSCFLLDHCIACPSSIFGGFLHQ